MEDPTREAIHEAVADLLGDAATPVPSPAEDRPRARRRSLEIIGTDRIDPRPHNRAVFEERVDKLADHIHEHGLHYHIMVRPVGTDDGGQRYRVIDGEHRLLAHRKLDRPKIPCVVDYDMTDSEAENASSSANRRRWAPSLWDDFVEVLQRRAEPGRESVDAVADLTCIDRTMVERMFSIQDHVEPELWSELELDPSWDTLVHLRAAGRLGRRDTREARRDKQVSWWKAQGWKNVQHVRRKRRPPTCRVLAKVSRIDPNKLYLGRDVIQWLLWTLGFKRVNTEEIRDAAE